MFDSLPLALMDVEIFASIVAHILYHIDPTLDEHDVYDIICEYAANNELNMSSIEPMIRMIQTARFNPERHILN